MPLRTQHSVHLNRPGPWRALAGTAAALALVATTLPAAQADEIPPETEAPQNELAPQPDAAAPAQPAPQTLEVNDPDALYSAFYAQPEALPAAPGELIRQESSNFYLGPAQLVRMGASSTRIMYSTTNTHGEIVGVTGTVLESKNSWQGSGPRPVVTYAVGTQGVANQCAPSVQGETGTNYESASINALLLAGYNVVVTDYIGLGTEGVHTFMNRKDQGHAVLDAARAATQVGIDSIEPESPVAVVGYSQGGGGAGAAAELAEEYAPELPLTAAVVGAPPADLQQVAAKIDDSIYYPFLVFALQGFAETYGLDRSELLNEEGLALFDEVSTHCTVDALFSSKSVDSSSLTTTGLTMAEMTHQEPLKSIAEEQQLGVNAAPPVPTLINHSLTDDVIPYRTGRDLAGRWCAAGTEVTFHHSLMPTHIGGYVGSFIPMLSFLDRQFAGKSSSNHCWQFR
ncbi:MAG: lipase family protein [Micrococcaceae bacterium]